jgi:hypothetical protein
MLSNSEILSEGLRANDLEGMINSLFEIDSYRSKMGDDRDICVLTFRVKDRSPARDMMEFVEKGYGFVLDSDVSSGENDKGEYFVFVELPRTPRLNEQIKEIVLGVKRLAGIDDWKFKYHKAESQKELNLDSLTETVPSTPEKYDLFMNRVKTEGFKNFFNKTLMDDLELENDIITIFKPYGNKIKLRIVKEDEKDKILENSEDTFSLDSVAMGEIFWLTKVIGDYNINKLGDKFVFENGDKAMILQRIEQ